MPFSFKDNIAPVGPNASGPRLIRAARSPAMLAAGALAAGAFAAGCTGTAFLDSGDTSSMETRLRLPPIVWWDRSPDGDRQVRNFLGFLYGQRAESMPAHEGDGNDRIVSRNSLHVLWPLYHRSSAVRGDGMRTTSRSLMPFVWTSRKSEPSGKGADYVQRRIVVPPLLFSLKADNYGSGQLEYEFLWPLGKYFRGERFADGRREMARSFILRPFVRYERTWPLATGAGSPQGSERPGETLVLRVLKPLFGYERDADLQRKRVFLLGGVLDGGETDGERTLGLLAAEKGPATDYEIQAGWQLFMVKRSGSEALASRAFVPERPSDLWRATKWLFSGSPRKQFRLGPIIDYDADWSGDRKEFSLLFGLVSYVREGDRRQGRFLWIIPWRP
jgi:hypothetical protein